LILTEQKLGSPIFSRTFTINQFETESNEKIYFLPENTQHPQYEYFIQERDNNFKAFFVLKEPDPAFLFHSIFNNLNFPFKQNIRPRMLPNLPNMGNSSYIWINRLDPTLSNFQLASIKANKILSPPNVSFNSSFQYVHDYPTTIVYAGGISFSRSLDFTATVYLVRQSTISKYTLEEWFGDINFDYSEDYRSISLDTTDFQTSGTAYRIQLSPWSEPLLISFVKKDGSNVNRVYVLDGAGFALTKTYSFKGRVEATLNNQNLILVRDGAYYEVYSTSEERVARFPAGSLTFCHERWDNINDKWYSVFSRALINKTDSGYKIRVDAFEYPSDKLGDLGK
jgi:hypothetical protein